jgi:hypothetical protein
VLVGGNIASTGKQHDTWEWDGTAWMQVVTTGAYTPREYASVVWSPSDAGFLLFGGNDRDITLHDTWLYRWAEQL